MAHYEFLVVTMKTVQISLHLRKLSQN